MGVIYRVGASKIIRELYSMKFIVLAISLYVGISLAGAAMAGGNHGGRDHGESVAGLPTTGIDSSEGEITRIDKTAGKVFVKHGDMKKIGMFAMLMVFDIRDAAMLNQVNVGDKVRFTVERNGAQLTVTKIESIQLDNRTANFSLAQIRTGTC